MEPLHISKKQADDLIVAHYDFARKKARCFCSRSRITDCDEYESEALLALVKSTRNFDPSKGWQFSTYAGCVIDDHLKKLRRKNWSRYSEEDPSFSPDSIVSTADHAAAVIEKLDERAMLASDLELLHDERHKDALLRRIAGETMSEIAARHNVNETTVRRWLWNLHGKS